MTSTRYYIARFAQAFGLNRKNNRMLDAASEMHLLREAEAYLGMEVWQKVETIESLSVEYWNLRRLAKDKEAAQQRLTQCQERLDQAHEERVTVLNNTPEVDQELLDKRVESLNELERLTRERDRIVIDAREIRRAYVGMKMKLEVITKEGGATATHTEEVTQVKARLLELKNRFAELKEQRVRIGEAIEKGDAIVDAIDEKLAEARQSRRGLASSAFQVIGEGNKEISTLRAETSLIDTKMRQLYAEIGRYVSRNATLDPACSAAALKHRSLIDVMRALRRSIALNHRLAGTA